MSTRRWAAIAAVLAIFAVPAGGTAQAKDTDSGAATAWRHGALQVDTRGLISRSDLVLDDPAWRDYESMPLGNGHLGAAVWAQDGLTAQLNRNDTFPALKSAGQLVVPGLFDLVSARDYRGRLDLYDAELEQSGGGMSARSYVRSDRDQFVVEVAGADPGERQTAELKLWEGRSPATYAHGPLAALAETFTDEASGTRTGAIAALTATGRHVAAEVVDEHTVRLSFKPRRDGSFRIVVGVPFYTGGDLDRATRRAVVGARRAESPHLRWWHRFWRGTAPMRVDSADGTGEYMETLRALQLYLQAATQRSSVPSDHGGSANMLRPWGDGIHWSADYWWHFNLRQEVFANFGADTEELNEPYFRLYLDRLQAMRDWTATHWPGAEGICLPEYFRFDGTAGACDSSAEPTWVNRILTGGLEVAHNLWLQYRYTGERSVLERGYPLMRDAARFYLSVLEPGDDGYLHLNHVNALETQWDTSDPTPDLAAMRVMFPIIARLAADHGDTELADRLRAAIPKIPPFRTTTRNGEPVIAWSATDEPAHNTQDPDMDALFPWGVFGRDSALMQSTFRNRVFVQTREWGEDPIWAARLGLADEMKRLLVDTTETFQIYPSGFTGHGKNDDPTRIHNLYCSWNAIVAGALQEALVQSYEGVVRVASAWPAGWDVSGAVKIEGGHRVSAEVRDGVPRLVGIEAGRDDTLRIANPWPGEAVRVVDGRHGGSRPIAGPTTAAVVTVLVKAGRSYVLERTDEPYGSLRFQRLGGTAATEVKHLGRRTLGVQDGTPQIHSDVVSVVKPDKLHALVRAANGVAYYVDRSYTIADLPPALSGTVLVRGANDDSKLTSPPDYLVLRLTRPTTVYVAFDARGEGKWWPDWLEEFTRTGMTVRTTDAPLVVFEKRMPSGTVALGPNSGVPGQGSSSYITFVDEGR